jgi:excisionase family DNA binding protein
LPTRRNLSVAENLDRESDYIMAKKYLTLEEAAARLSIPKDELIKLRERGDIRGFADRGNWKFKVDDVEELARTRSADSDPDVPIALDPADSGFFGSEEPQRGTGDSSLVLGVDDDDEFGGGLGTSDSDVRLVMDEDISPDVDESGLLMGGEDSSSDINLVADEGSDSDVMLVGGESDILAVGDADDSSVDSDSDVKLVAGDSDSDIKLIDPDSDSDVNLVEASDSDSDIQLSPVDESGIDADEATDSDVALVTDLGGTDSDIRLATDEMRGSDSDVRLMAGDSGSDITLASNYGSDSDVRLVADVDSEGSDSDVQLIDSSSADAKTSDSDIAIISADDSAIALDMDQDDDAGSVLGDDSGIALGGGSSITLASESGISLEGPTDSGISLDLDDEEGITLADDDSGISLGEAGDSGIALASDDDLGGTMPMMDAVDDDEVAETQFEIPSLSGEESEFDIDAMGDDGDTSVMDLEDSGELDDAVFDVDADDSGELGGLSDELELDDEYGDEEDLGELDVFEDEGDFEEGFQSGESQGELVIPARAAAVETEWGTGPFVGLIASTTLLAVLGIVMADLVSSMWGWSEPNAVAGSLLGIFGGLF